ncbi:hypothetical protein OA90_20055 [Labrenzia sp. OB1]|nr:hypothetical protein OA90_20055 [Labrenzia sp. OB1]
MQTDELVQRLIDFADASGADGEPQPVGIAGMTLVRQRRPRSISPSVYQPIFCLVLQGAKEIHLGSGIVRFGRLQSLIVGLDLLASARIVTASSAEPYVALALKLDMGLIRELAAELPDRAGSSRGAAVESGAADAAVVDAMRRLFDLAFMDEARQVLEPMVRREIHYWLLSAGHGRILRELAVRDSRASRVARAVAAIHRDYASVLKIENLARLAGMSVSAFHAGFKELTGSSPLQFQKQLRLIEARRLLQGEGVSVSGAAFQVGYESASQFSREYSRQFGVSPRVDKALEIALS